MAVKAKFRCSYITDFGSQKEAKLEAVYGNGGENSDFSKLTPYGELRIKIDSEAPASSFFEPSKEYYLTFEEA